jgi:dTDP-4-amino-4,6-dideoxygalactose transaminase
MSGHHEQHSADYVKVKKTQTCVDATAALKSTLQILTNAGQEAYVVFVDPEKP